MNKEIERNGGSCRKRLANPPAPTGGLHRDWVFELGADTLAGSSGGGHASRLGPPQQARGLSGKVPLALDIDQVSLFDPTTEQRL
jgi:hypothetical protein